MSWSPRAEQWRRRSCLLCPQALFGVSLLMGVRYTAMRQLPCSGDQMPARDPPIGGLIDKSREHSVRMGVRGGAGGSGMRSPWVKLEEVRANHDKFLG
jgi:hypothetical protein